MSAIKLQVVRVADGDTSVDFRGDKFKGHDQGDEHRTIAEIDPAPQALVDEVLRDGELANRLLSRLEEAEPGFAGKAADLLGLSGTGPVRIRVRVYDN